MHILEFWKDHLVYLDGGMGTLLQARGLGPGELPERRRFQCSKLRRQKQREGQNFSVLQKRLPISEYRDMLMP